MKTQESKDYSPADYHSRRFKVCDLPKGLHDLEEVEILVTYTGEGSARKGIAVDNVVVPLFKASPELLETLRRCANYLSRQVEFDDEGEAIFGEHIPLLTQALDAISKATGEE
jgi:hypothetical protein